MASKASKKHYIVIVGARPNFIKAAAFFRGARKNPHIKFTLIHTGQHFDENMSKVFFEEMQIPHPDINLDIKGEFHTEKIGKMFDSLKKILSKKKIDGVIVFGDINSTLAGAVATAKNNIKLFHVESGLRSHDRRMPEEINRVIVDHLSDILFTSEPIGKENLLKEGVEKSKIIPVGNIMIESLEAFKSNIELSDILTALKLKPRSYVVATIHRQENTDDKKILQRLFMLLNEINKVEPVIIPLHPGTKNKLINFKLGNLLKKLHVVEPLGYFEFLKLVSQSNGVVTDSGGIQEETSHMGIACATLRDNTERPVTITLGTNKLFPISEMDDKTAQEILKHLKRAKKETRIPLWDDKVSDRIFKHL